MGDRYTLTANADQLSVRFNKELADWYQPKYNAAPTQLLPVLTQMSDGFSFFHWGQIPEWSKNKTISGKLIFTEKSGLLEKASSKMALQSHRCLIPIDGYYDWKKISKKGRVAHRVVFGNNEIVGLAGIWEEFEDENGTVNHTFKIITTMANEALKSMNPMMPVIIDKTDEATWLSGETDSQIAFGLLKQYPSNKTSIYSVSPRIEDVTIDNKSLIDPFAPADQFGNYSLFD